MMSVAEKGDRPVIPDAYAAATLPGGSSPIHGSWVALMQVGAGAKALATGPSAHAPGWAPSLTDGNLESVWACLLCQVGLWASLCCVSSRT